MRISVFLLIAYLFTHAHAADKSNTYRTIPGATILEARFDVADFPKAWKKAKGTWTIVDGSLQGQIIEEDHHPASCGTKAAVPTNSILTADVLFEGKNSATFTFNGVGGHLCRIIVKNEGFSVSVIVEDKEDKTLKGGTLGEVKQTFTTGQWIHITVEMIGEEMFLFTDDKHVLYGRNPALGRAKGSFAFTVAGEGSVRFDNLLIRAAEPNPEWDKNKIKLGIK